MKNKIRVGRKVAWKAKGQYDMVGILVRYLTPERAVVKYRVNREVEVPIDQLEDITDVR